MKFIKILVVLLLPIGQLWGCQAAGIRANFDRGVEEDSPTFNPERVTPIQQTVSFLSVGSTEMSSELYHGVGSLGFFSQGISQNVSFLMLGPSLAVEASFNPNVEVLP